MPTAEQQRRLDAAINSFFSQVEEDIGRGVVPAFIKGNLQLQSSEGIRPSFDIAQTSARNWYQGYRYQLEQGGGNIWNRETEEYDWVPWMEEWKQETRGKFAELIDDAMDEGWSIDQTSDEIQDLLDVEAVRGDRIARTEIARAMFYGRMARTKQAGYTKVRWRTAPDRDDVEACDECKALDRQVFDVDEIPEQPLHPNCRCTFQPLLSSLKYPSERFPRKVRPAAVEVAIPAPPIPIVPEPPKKEVTPPAKSRKQILKELSPFIKRRNEVKGTIRQAAKWISEANNKTIVLMRDIKQELINEGYSFPSEEANKELVRRYDIRAKEIQNRINTLNDLMAGAQDDLKYEEGRIREQFQKVVENPNPIPFEYDVKFNEELNRDRVSRGQLPVYATPAQKEAFDKYVKSGLDWIARHTNNSKIQGLPLTVEGFFPDAAASNIGFRSRRAFYDPSTKKLYIPIENPNPSTIIHEPFHRIYYASPEVKEKMDRFLLSRIGKSRKIVDIVKRLESAKIPENRMPGEYVIKDFVRLRSADPREFKRGLIYGGKIYISPSAANELRWSYVRDGYQEAEIPATWDESNISQKLRSQEAITVGVELMFSDPVRFALREPEYFDIIYEILWGV